jgi:uncharacterized membrane protein YtjA (UPF0391 family)
MLTWALIFFLVTIAAAVLGFGFAAAAFAAVAKLIFYIAIVLLVVSLAGHVLRRV